MGTLFFTSPARLKYTSLTGAMLGVFIGVSATASAFAATLTEITPVASPTEDRSPDLVFSSTSAGTITYGGDCSSTKTMAIAGNNTVTFRYLALGTHTNCRISVTDASGIISEALIVSPFTIHDITPSALSIITPVMSPTADNTPDLVFATTENGTIRYSGACSSTKTIARKGNNTITLNKLVYGTYNNCSLELTDAAGNVSSALPIPEFILKEMTPPLLTENTAVITPGEDMTPDYIFNTSEGGGISYTGGCSSTKTTARKGSNSLTFKPLPLGTYSTCQIRVTDAAGNISLPLNISSFTIHDITAPQLTETKPISSPTEDPTPDVIFNSSEKGSILFSGNCSSNKTAAVAGNNVITLNVLALGLHDNCSIQVKDSSNNLSAPLLISPFVVQDTITPTLSQVAGITSSQHYLFNASEAGSINTSGNCTINQTTAMTGINSLVFSTFTPDNSCMLTITDAGNNTSMPLMVTTHNRSDARPNIIVIVSDDQGYADLGVQNIDTDIQTPNIDTMAQQGIRMTSGYVTAPQCAPSRAALLTGKYQQRFGLEENSLTPLRLSQETLGNRLQQLGYTTGLTGKYHVSIDNDSLYWLGINHPDISPLNFTINQIPIAERNAYKPNHRGFDEVFSGFMLTYWANIDQLGNDIAEQDIRDNRFRVDVVSQASTAFIQKHAEQPFYLTVNYFAPHAPLEAPAKYLNKVPLYLPEKRRYALAMLDAVDTGVGAIINTLKDNDIYENTLIFFISDNGAPLYQGGNGSKNLPLRGEKFMLTEGGIRVPYIMHWKGTLPENEVTDKPVSSLDIGTTALYLAGDSHYNNLDGVNLLDYLANPSASNDRTLFWRFLSQRAVRKGNWKYLSIGHEKYEFLYDLDTDREEQVNLIEQYPEIAAGLKAELYQWEADMEPQTLNSDQQEAIKYLEYYGLSL